MRSLAGRHGVRPSKALGQHFLTDPNLSRAIARDAGVGPGTRVVEVGAGLGSLTTALADAGAAEVLAIEFDAGMIPALEEVASSRPSIRVLHADATKLDWPATLGEGTWALCANLPYNVGTSIVLDVLETATGVERLVVMVQREVGERLAARAGEDAYGAVSVRVAYRARAELVRKVPPTVFWPRPSVGSVIVRLTRLPAPPVAVEQARLWRVVDEAFAQRRKTMRNALRRLGLEAAEADRVLGEVGVDPAARPEVLDLAAFARLAEAIAA
ncbi:MAG: 16S rRNA (adenine(1518)-N(6)/adenine(1519)-N(6))-dimethyltransferase RsmA [Planctomycetaceae bacterium]